MATTTADDDMASNLQHDTRDQVMHEILPSLEPPIRFLSLSRTYDKLQKALADEQDLVVQGRIDLPSIVDRQADYLRALKLASQLMIQMLDIVPLSSYGEKTQQSPENKRSYQESKEDETKETKQNVLKQTVVRCQLLLDVLIENFADHTADARDDHHGLLPRSRYEVLQMLGDDIFVHRDDDGTFTYDNEDPESEMLSFDKQLLEQEEQALINMANTPIPGEQGEEVALYTAETLSKINDLQSRIEKEWSWTIYQEDFRQKRHRAS